MDEKAIILKFINLGRGNIPEKEKLAAELGITLSALKYRVRKFKSGEGIGRKKRKDAGKPKKTIKDEIKMSFFAELAMGKSADQAGRELRLSDWQINKFLREYERIDKWAALRNAPQLNNLKNLLSDILRFDIALVNAELNGAFHFKANGVEFAIHTEELKDILTVLAHSMQRDIMGKADERFVNLSKDELLRVRITYLKELLLENKNIKEFTQLERATRINKPEREIDLKIAYAIIDKFKPGLDENDKILALREIIAKVRSES